MRTGQRVRGQAQGLPLPLRFRGKSNTTGQGVPGQAQGLPLPLRFGGDE